MNNSLYQELLKLCNECEFTKNMAYIEYAICLLDNLKVIFPYNYDIDQLYQKLSDISSMEMHEKHLEQVLMYRDNFIRDNKGFFDTMLPYVRNKKLNNPVFHSLEFDYFKKLLYGFLGSVSPRLLFFYKKIEKDGKIFVRSPSSKEKIFGYNSSESNGFVVPLNYCIYINKCSSILDLCVLVHEIAHAYYYYCNNYQVNELINPLHEIKEEIPARLLERLLIDYLAENGLTMYAYLLDLNYQDNIIKNIRNADLFNRYKYSIANFIAYELSPLINNGVTLEEFNNAIYENDYRIIIADTIREYDKKLSKIRA